MDTRRYSDEEFLRTIDEGLGNLLEEFTDREAYHGFQPSNQPRQPLTRVVQLNRENLRDARESLQGDLVELCRVRSTAGCAVNPLVGENALSYRQNWNWLGNLRAVLADYSIRYSGTPEQRLVSQIVDIIDEVRG